MTAYLTLLLGLLLPWLVGLIWLRALERLLKSDGQSHIAAQLGYGFFVGYAILFGCLHLADQLGVLGYWSIMIALSVLVIAGAVTGTKVGLPQSANSKASPMQSRQPHHWLFWLLLGLTCVHLLLNTWEVFYRPVYAWDAWTTWIYRAKVWFFSADIYQLASPKEWLADPDGATHAIPAYRYPTFPSVIPLWAVISFGQWSDTLVNTPVIGCGIALALALYGACRGEGLSATFSMAATYALISLPIVGAHLSLAGYADIWMAGFSGLGFVALLRGLIHSSSFNTLLGIGLLAVGICLKYEGLAWLVIGVGLTVVTLAASNRALKLVMLIGLLFVLFTTALGLTSVDLPVLGVLGIKDGFLYFPGLGRYQLVPYNVLPIYAESFFQRGSWHLLWTLTVLALVGLVFVRDTRLRGVLLAFYLLFAVSQLLIFGLTEKGKFAELNTAVNRLIIHFLPALLFGVVFTAHQLAEQWETQPKITDRHAGIFKIQPWIVATALTSVMLVMTGIWIATSLSTPHSANSSPALAPVVSFEPQNFQPVMGGGRLEAGVLVINQFDRGMAIASRTGMTIDTQHYPVVSYNLDIAGSSTAMFFWRNEDTPRDIHMTLIDPPGDSTLFLANHAQWGERITELGIVAYGVAGDEYQLSEMSLRSWGSAQQLELIVDDWFTYEPITQKFINWIDGGRKVQLVHLTSVLALALIVTILCFFVVPLLLRRRKFYPTPVHLAAFALTIWMFADTVWLKNRMVQAYDTKNVYGDRIDPKRNERANEGFPFQATVAAIQPLVGQSDEILVVPQTERMWFEAARLKLQLAPIETYADASGILAIPTHWQEPILIVKDPRQDRDGILEQASTQSGLKLSIRYEDAHIMLLAPQSKKASEL